MRHITGRRATITRPHPDWCHQTRCDADLHQLGEHRSEPITILGAAGARLIATRIQSQGARHWLELRVVVPLDRASEPRRAGLAHLIMHDLVASVTRTLRRPS